MRGAPCVRNPAGGSVKITLSGLLRPIDIRVDDVALGGGIEVRHAPIHRHTFAERAERARRRQSDAEYASSARTGQSVAQRVVDAYRRCYRLAYEEFADAHFEICKQKGTDFVPILSAREINPR